jgi:hypothetical protein
VKAEIAAGAEGKCEEVQGGGGGGGGGGAAEDDGRCGAGNGREEQKRGTFPRCGFKAVRKTGSASDMRPKKSRQSDGIDTVIS